MKVGVIGCGKIFGAYAKGAKLYKELDLVACADLDVERAKQVAAEHEIAKGCSVDDLLADDAIELVINLTIPGAHAAVDRRIIEAGKHCYSEKPLAVTTAEIDDVVALAKDKNLRLGSAPDTFLGGGIQTCRKLIDEGAIGTPVSAVAFMGGPGHESWHPSPQFYYQAGGGPLFDMGPYYITALVNLLGPVRAVAGFSGRARTERVITSEPLNGTVIPVEVDTHYAANLQFENGVMANMIMSFDMWKHNLPRIEIYGTEGSLCVPDPNTFRGPIQICKGREDFTEVELTHPEGMRGAGPADIIHALQGDRPHRCSAELAYHVLEVMQTVGGAGEAGVLTTLQSRCERPAAVPPGLDAGLFD